MNHRICCDFMDSCERTLLARCGKPDTTPLIQTRMSFLKDLRDELGASVAHNILRRVSVLVACEDVCRM